MRILEVNLLLENWFPWSDFYQISTRCTLDEWILSQNGKKSISQLYNPSIVDILQKVPFMVNIMMIV